VSAANHQRSLLQTLLDDPWRFGFDAAVAVMMHVANRRDPSDVIQFHAPTGLGFVPADILSVTRDSKGFNATIGLSGLTGPSGVLPRAYTEMANTEQRRRSFALSAFLDLLAQRPLAHFATAALKFRPHRAAATAALNGEPAIRPGDAMREALLAFVGYAAPGAVESLAIGGDSLLYYSGAFAAWPRSTDQLAAMLSDWIGQNVEIEQFAGTWLNLGPEEMSRLPSGGRPGRFDQLGVDATIGARTWDIQSRIVLRIGPLPWAEFTSLLPGGILLGRLIALTRAYLGDQTSFVVNPVLAAHEVPRPTLGGIAPPRLGMDGWLPTTPKRPRDGTEAWFGCAMLARADVALVQKPDSGSRRNASAIA
jgi:type VI secretion system protein ImpH